VESPFPTTLPHLLTARKIRPSVIPAASSHLRTATSTQSGTGTVRIRPPLPEMSTKTARPSRSWRSETVRPTSSPRRSANPTPDFLTLSVSQWRLFRDRREEVSRGHLP
jgi:hypothetical protein